MRKALFLTLLLSSCAAPGPEPVGAAMQPIDAPPVVVNVRADGSFDPPTVYIHAGDTVEWRFTNADDAVVAASNTGAWLPDACLTPKPWDESSFAGPQPVGASGLWSISPYGTNKGFEVALAADGCRDGSTAVLEPDIVPASDQVLCATGERGETMMETWENPAIRGVHIRLDWKDLQPTIDYHTTPRIDTTILAREMNRAVSHGKLFSLSIRAGKHGTPDWIFSDNPTPGPVPRLHFEDGGSKLEDGKCGSTIYLGNPTRIEYRNLWGSVLEQVAAFVKSRSDWYRALAYVKLGGANLFTDENRLPKRCTPGCICNTRVWAADGYTPTGLYAFYNWQRQRLGELFPGKPIDYMLIQAGFPRVSDSLCWLEETEDPADDDETACFDWGSLSVVTTPGTDGLPGGTEQTAHILADGEADPDYGRLFVVQHNGLAPGPGHDVCPTYHQHPASGSTPSDPDGCPNHWVLQAGALEPLGQLTGFQTNNESGVGNPAELDSALQNAWNNSDGAFVELYEDRLWEAGVYEQNGVFQSHTLAEWGDRFDNRRTEDLVSRTGLADPNTRVYRHTFWSAPLESTTVYYYNPTRCGRASPRTGSIVIQ